MRTWIWFLLMLCFSNPLAGRELGDKWEGDPRADVRMAQALLEAPRPHRDPARARRLLIRVLAPWHLRGNAPSYVVLARAQFKKHRLVAPTDAEWADEAAAARRALSARSKLRATAGTAPTSAEEADEDEGTEGEEPGSEAGPQPAVPDESGEQLYGKHWTFRKKDKATARRYLIAAAEKGYPPGIIGAALDLLEGTGGPRDPERAFGLLRPLAARGDTLAKYHLGHALYKVKPAGWSEEAQGHLYDASRDHYNPDAPEHVKEAYALWEKIVNEQAPRTVSQPVNVYAPPPVPVARPAAPSAPAPAPPPAAPTVRPPPPCWKCKGSGEQYRNAKPERVEQVLQPGSHNTYDYVRMPFEPAKMVPCEACGGKGTDGGR